MTISFLKSIKDLNPQGSVKYMLHNFLSGAEPARPLSRVHASDTTKDGGICPRMYALADVTKLKPKAQWLTTSEQVTFELGRQLQDSVVNWFADMGKAFCHWKCGGCNNVQKFTLRPLKCPVCASHNFHPEEIRFLSAVTGVSCGVDMIVAMGAKKMHPVEIKTMAADEFKQLKAPLAEHAWRTNLYLRIMAESEEPWSNSVSTNSATVLYISKNGYGCADPTLKTMGINEQYSPFKEYTVLRDDTKTDDIVKPAVVVKAFRDGKVGMPGAICTHALQARALKCPMKASCFSGNYPAEYDWQHDEV